MRSEIKKSDLIFSGKVIAKKILSTSIEGINDKFQSKEAEYTILIEHLYKGTVKQETVKIITGLGNGDCGFIFNINDNYIIYAEYTDEGSSFNNDAFYYSTSICMRTTQSVMAEKDKLKKYKRLLKTN